MPPEVIGVFGGTFDPPHLGHLVLAGEALWQLRLNRLLWVLNPQPPHKPNQPISPLEHRAAMLKLALAETPGFEFSTIEMERPGPHYTIDTLDRLQEKHPSSRLALLIGGDSLRDLPAWHRPQEIVTAVSFFGVMRRPGDLVDDLSGLERSLPGIRAKVQFFNTPMLEISSSEIRRRAAAGLPFRHFLPKVVYDYIERNHLYT